ncbi:LOW QUALITY PROTEIN: small integral membrane protein 15 [Pterocles gutturalis]
MFDIKAWAEYIVDWAAKDPYGFLTTVILALTPLFVISAALSWKLAKIEAREREQKKKQKRQENIAKAKRTRRIKGGGGVRRPSLCKEFTLKMKHILCCNCPLILDLLFLKYEI